MHTMQRYSNTQIWIHYKVEVDLSVKRNYVTLCMGATLAGLVTGVSQLVVGIYSF
jgi:hypothetical protein